MRCHNFSSLSLSLCRCLPFVRWESAKLFRSPHLGCMRACRLLGAADLRLRGLQVKNDRCVNRFRLRYEQLETVTPGPQPARYGATSPSATIIFLSVLQKRRPKPHPKSKRGTSRASSAVGEFVGGVNFCSVVVSFAMINENRNEKNKKNLRRNKYTEKRSERHSKDFNERSMYERATNLCRACNSTGGGVVSVSFIIHCFRLCACVCVGCMQLILLFSAVGPIGPSCLQIIKIPQFRSSQKSCTSNITLHLPFLPKKN